MGGRFVPPNEFDNVFFGEVTPDHYMDLARICGFYLVTFIRYFPHVYFCRATYPISHKGEVVVLSQTSSNKLAYSATGRVDKRKQRSREYAVDPAVCDAGQL